MASHLVVELTKFRMELLKEALHELKGTNALIDVFESVELKDHPAFTAMLLPTKEYRMDEYHGFEDKEIVLVKRKEDALEYHLGEDGSVNEVYLVM